MKNKSVWLLIIIFVVFSFFRFYNIDKRIIFDWDQEQFSYQIKNIVKNGDFTLLGPRANNDRGFFLGPYFTYLLVPFYLVTSLHPNALVIFIVLYNLLFFGLSYRIISKIFSPTHALLFLLFWGVNYLLATYDAIPWWPLLLPLGVLLTWITLYRIYDKPDWKNYALLGLTLSFFSNLHFQFIFMILFSIIFLLLSLKKNKLFRLPNIGSLTFSFAFLFAPLFLFDLRNNFLNTKLFFGFFFSSDPSTGKELLAWIPVFTNFIHPLIYVKENTLAIAFLVLTIPVVLYLIKNKKGFLNIFYKCFLVLWLITPVFFALYGKRPSEYYYVYLYPFILIMLVDFVMAVKNKYLMIIVSIILVLFNIQALIKNLEVNPRGLHYKDQSIKLLKENIDLSKKFNVSLDTPLGSNNGYKYLLEQNGIVESGNWENDPLIEIRVPARKGDLSLISEIGFKVPAEVRK